MVKKIKKLLNKIFSQRSLILLAIFLVMTVILITRIFQLQIVHVEDYA